jgi:hypothetical protein
MSRSLGKVAAPGSRRGHHRDHRLATAQLSSPMKVTLVLPGVTQTYFHQPGRFADAGEKHNMPGF